MTGSTQSDDLVTLLDALCRRDLTAEQSVRLQHLLHSDPNAIRTYLEYIDLHLGLRHLTNAAIAGSSARVEPEMASDYRRAVARRATLSRASKIAVAVMVLALAIVAVIPRRSVFNQTATVSLISGSVEVAGRNGVARSAAEGMVVGQGEKITATGQDSFVSITLRDGTRLALIGNAAATLLPGTKQDVVLNYGVASLDVQPRSAGNELRIATPAAMIDVLGTEFIVAATDARTHVNVSHGRVRLTRLTDGKSVEVREGHTAISTNASELDVRRSAAPLDDWREDFEAGLPNDWFGREIGHDLPGDSRGAVTAKIRDDSDLPVHAIVSSQNWIAGSCSVHADSQLTFTFRMERPDWLNIFLFTRDADPAKPSPGMYRYNALPFLPPRPDEWRTVSIPLALFQKKLDGRFQDAPPISGEVAWQLMISSTGEDRGLVIDDLAITRGGTGQFVEHDFPK